MPKLHLGITEFVRLAAHKASDEELERAWRELPSETIDYGVMEKSQNAVVIPAELGWSDVGDWAAVYKAMHHDVLGNAVTGGHLSPDTRDSLIGSSRLVVTLGLDDLIIVDTPDVLMVCPRARAQDIKQLAGLLQEHGVSEYLSTSVTGPPTGHRALSTVEDTSEPDG